ncbi:zinc finger MYM-type protein 1-like isoform X1 [Coccinella septempunctata]|uniref:zinc finger MYM-type protein 1-like isoform X1 n=1 Tax=Coccinella septempunctata TaxID=41139 RepID=UPI001D0601DF|nr:zinc finger MYM-type protein 1-like isoform X1 [Coccinella septempunctata]
MISLGEHIKNIKDILRNDREFPNRMSDEMLQRARAVAMDLNIEISIPRLAHKQTHRSNPPSDNDNEYWRRSLIIPYIDSLISSLNIRFSQENTPAFALSKLHPLYMTKTSITDLHKNAESFQEFYNLDITGELNLWHNLWVKKALTDDQLRDIEVVDLFNEANIFYPAVRKALIILSTIPCTTATVERSFSTLRRVKTWLRSTMGEERLTGLCLMSVHRNYSKENSEFIEKTIIDKFSSNPRRLLLN